CRPEPCIWPAPQPWNPISDHSRNYRRRYRIGRIGRKQGDQISQRNECWGCVTDFYHGADLGSFGFHTKKLYPEHRQLPDKFRGSRHMVGVLWQRLMAQQGDDHVLGLVGLVVAFRWDLYRKDFKRPNHS